MESIRDTEVLIAGAGPTGLVLALWLTRLGVRVRIVDETTQPGTTSRALAVQARTLELYRQIGLADTVAERGHRVDAVNLWVAGKRKARAVFGALGAGLSPFPYALTFAQDEHERLLIDQLAGAGVAVERQTELLGFAEKSDGVAARLKRADGSIESCNAVYLAGCDGAHSAVRQALNFGFPGGTYEHVFYVADVEASGPAMNGELHVALDSSDFLAVFPLKGETRARLVGTVRDQAQGEQKRTWDDVSTRVIEWMRIDIARVNWFSTYRVHHRVASRFRNGRAFLLGDAAHVHSPVGGQGMNTGIGDAVNLAWKLAAVLQERADSAVLDSYEPERMAFAQRLVATTDRAFTGVTSSSALARLIRLDLVPLLLPQLFRLSAVRRFMFRTVSQTTVNYRHGSLSEGSAGAVRGGDRLPWIKLRPGDNEDDNFAPMTSLDWQVHVYGAADAALQKLCSARHLPLHSFPWLPEMRHAGLRQNAAYLLRPDGYIGLVDAGGNATTIASYLEKWRIKPRPIMGGSRDSGERNPAPR